MDIEQLKAENAALRDSIASHIAEYIRITGLTPSIDIDYVSSIGAPARPLVHVVAVIR